jgi:AraC family transcriptional regulator, arabinose operon regulatory protein
MAPPPITVLHRSTLCPPLELAHGLSVGRWAGEGDYRCRRPNTNEAWSFFYTLSGQGEFRHASGTLTASEGDIVLLCPFFPHDYRRAPSARHWDYYWAGFVPLPQWDQLLKWHRPAPGLLHRPANHVENGGQVFDLMVEIHQRQVRPGAHSRLFHQNLFERVLLLLSEPQSHESARRFDPRIERAMDVIHANLGSRLAVQEVARAAGVSYSRLAHLFAEELGVSVADFIENARMVRAQDLLTTCDLPLKEIAAQVGFADYFHFSRRFKVRTGNSPTAYARSLRAGGGKLVGS